MSLVVLPPKPLGATIKQVFDFISALAVGETISTASVAATVWSGVDATPGSLVSGAASISGTKVTQTLTGGVAGTIYKLVCTVTTSASQTLQLVGYLVVLRDPM
jgi:hypothetical protein